LVDSELGLSDGERWIIGFGGFMCFLVIVFLGASLVCSSESESSAIGLERYLFFFRMGKSTE